MRTAKEVIEDKISYYGWNIEVKPNSNLYNTLIEAMKQYAREALIEASERAEINTYFNHKEHFNATEIFLNHHVNKESIINITLE